MFRDAPGPKCNSRLNKIFNSFGLDLYDIVSFMQRIGRSMELIHMEVVIARGTEVEKHKV